jgi:hypothetical protein
MTWVVLAGANPGVRLTDGDGVRVGVDGRLVGTALVLWHDHRVRAVGADPHRPSAAAFPATAEVWSV